jgi:hypothetical protein
MNALEPRRGTTSAADAGIRKRPTLQFEAGNPLPSLQSQCGFSHVRDQLKVTLIQIITSFKK